MEMFGVICGGAWRYLVEGIAAKYVRHLRKSCKAFPTDIISTDNLTDNLKFQSLSH